MKGFVEIGSRRRLANQSSVLCSQTGAMPDYRLPGAPPIPEVAPPDILDYIRIAEMKSLETVNAQ